MLWNGKGCGEEPCFCLPGVTIALAFFQLCPEQGDLQSVRSRISGKIHDDSVDKTLVQ